MAAGFLHSTDGYQIDMNGNKGIAHQLPGMRGVPGC